MFLLLQRDRVLRVRHGHRGHLRLRGHRGHLRHRGRHVRHGHRGHLHLRDHHVRLPRALQPQ